MHPTTLFLLHRVGHPIKFLSDDHETSKSEAVKWISAPRFFKRTIGSHTPSFPEYINFHNMEHYSNKRQNGIYSRYFFYFLFLIIWSSHPHSSALPKPQVQTNLQRNITLSKANTNLPANTFNGGVVPEQTSKKRRLIAENSDNNEEITLEDEDDGASDNENFQDESESEVAYRLNFDKLIACSDRSLNVVSIVNAQILTPIPRICKQSKVFNAQGPNIDTNELNARKIHIIKSLAAFSLESAIPDLTEYGSFVSRPSIM